jgi:hypothetical protein
MQLRADNVATLRVVQFRGSERLGDMDSNGFMRVPR